MAVSSSLTVPGPRAKSAIRGAQGIPGPNHVWTLRGGEVTISFKWSKPTSVLQSLALASMLVRVEEDILVVDVDKTVRSEEQERVLDALEKHGKLRNNLEGHSVYVFRKEIAELRLRPRISTSQVTRSLSAITPGQPAYGSRGRP